MQTRWRDDVGIHLNIEVRFQINCDCGVEGDCERVGLVGRVADASNRLSTFLDQDDEGCFFRIHRTSDVAGGEVIARSAYIGIPITNSVGEILQRRRKSAVSSKSHPIDDGEWHTLRLQMEQSVVRTWLDGRLIAAGLDNTELGTGAGVMVRTNQTSFDDFQAWQTRLQREAAKSTRTMLAEWPNVHSKSNPSIRNLGVGKLKRNR